jgi:hypothetical protein
MKLSIVFVALLGLFAAAALPASASASPSHKHHKVKRHKGVKHQA